MHQHQQLITQHVPSFGGELAANAYRKKQFGALCTPPACTLASEREGIYYYI